MTGYITKNPPVKLLMNEELFNSFVQLLAENEDSNNETLSQEAKQLKEKILKYSVIHTDEDGCITIDVRLFVSEASKLIMQLINEDGIATNTDYVSVLKANKKSTNE